MTEFARVLQRLEKGATERPGVAAAQPDGLPVVSEVSEVAGVDLQPVPAAAKPTRALRGPRTGPPRSELPFGQVVQSGFLERLRLIVQTAENPLVVLAGASAREQLRPLLDQLVRQAKATQVDLLALELEASEGRRVREVSGSGESLALATPEAAAPEALDAWLAEISEGRELVVLVAPGLVPSVDGALLARKASGLLLVAEAMRTPRAALAEAAERALAVGCTVHGVVLLGARRWLPRWLDRLLREVVD